MADGVGSVLLVGRLSAYPLCSLSAKSVPGRRWLRRQVLAPSPHHVMRTCLRPEGLGGFHHGIFHHGIFYHEIFDGNCCWLLRGFAVERGVREGSGAAGRKGAGGGGRRVGARALNRVLFQPDEVSETGQVLLPSDDVRAVHMCSVLRVAVGQRVRVGIVNGESGFAEVKAVPLAQRRGPEAPVEATARSPPAAAAEAAEVAWAAAASAAAVAARRGESYASSVSSSSDGHLLLQMVERDAASSAQGRSALTLDTSPSSSAPFAAKPPPSDPSSAPSTSSTSLSSSSRSSPAAVVQPPWWRMGMAPAGAQEGVRGVQHGHHGRITLLLALPRPKAMRRLWSVVGQLGLAAVVVTGAARVERFYFDSQALEPAVVRRELLRGLEQCGDTMVPHVSLHMHLRQTLNALLGAAGPLKSKPKVEHPKEHSTAAFSSEGASEAAAGEENMERRAAVGHTDATAPAAEAAIEGDGMERKEAARETGATASAGEAAPAGNVAAAAAAVVGASRVEKDRLPPSTLSVSSNALLLVAHPGASIGIREAAQQHAAALRHHAASLQQHAAALQQDAGVQTSITVAATHPSSVEGEGQALSEGERGSGGFEVVLAVGPEGGWTPPELEQLHSAGFVAVGLGGRPLRTDVSALENIGNTQNMEISRREEPSPKQRKQDKTKQKWGCTWRG